MSFTSNNITHNLIAKIICLAGITYIDKYVPIHEIDIVHKQMSFQTNTRVHRCPYLTIPICLCMYISRKNREN